MTAPNRVPPKLTAYPSRLWPAAILAVALLLFLATSTAHAELSQRGDLFVTFSGGLTPTALPRDVAAPIAVSVGGTITTLSGERPPSLRQIKIELNRGGHLDTHGLPRCRIAQLLAADPAEALANCGEALVGRGSYRAKTAYPEQSSFPSAGQILAFNALVDGKRAILAHLYGTQPAAISRVVVFRIRHSSGTFGTVISGELPPSINRYGYVRRIDLHLGRTFHLQGQRHSYLSAACGAPPGFKIASFPFARTSMTFADGRTLSSTLTRTCRVRG